MANGPKPYGRLIVSGILSAALYTLLFFYEKEVMTLFTRTDGLYFLLPVVTAFGFSLAHGAFTGYFWDVMGVQGRPRKGGK